MPDSTLAALPTASSVDGSEYFYLEAGGVAKKSLVSTARNYISREKLSADRTYYVRTDGSDSNDGLSNDAAGAFLTLSGALSAIERIDFNGYTVTLQFAAGTYASSSPITIPHMTGLGEVSNFLILGDASTPSNVIFNNTSASQYDNYLQTAAYSQVYLRGIKFTATNGGCITAALGGILHFDSLDFGACGSSAGHILATTGGTVVAMGNYTISGGAKVHFGTYLPGVIDIGTVSPTITLTGTPAFGTGAFGAFAVTDSGGYILGGGTFSGSATGQRFYCVPGAIIQTYGSGLSYFPGNSAGTITSVTNTVSGGASVTMCGIYM